MIFADKLIQLRKKASMSQEELADKLGVSRQSVSKWEGAQSIPDISKVIELSKIFGVSTDYLLKDEIEIEDSIDILDNTLTISLEETNEYLGCVNKSRYLVSAGVFLCIISPITLILLAMCSENYGLNENLMGGIGLITLIVLVAIAVALFIMSGSITKKYEFIEKKTFEIGYGVSGVVNEKKEKYRNKYTLINIIGITLCVLSTIPIFITSFIKDGKFVILGVSVLLFICAIGVFLIVLTGMKMRSYNKILQEGDYTKEKKAINPLLANVMTIFWLLATAIYLIWSFITHDWHITWVVWPVAGVLSPIISLIIASMKKD